MEEIIRASDNSSVRSETWDPDSQDAGFFFITIAQGRNFCMNSQRRTDFAGT